MNNKLFIMFKEKNPNGDEFDYLDYVFRTNIGETKKRLRYLEENLLYLTNKIDDINSKLNNISNKIDNINKEIDISDFPSVDVIGKKAIEAIMYRLDDVINELHRLG